MKLLFGLLGWLLVLASSMEGADEIKLEPCARWNLSFPQLPRTLASLVQQEKRPPQLAAWLPANYSPKGKYPLFLMLDGNDGGFGDHLPLRPGTVGSNDFIYVSLPLFKRAYARKGDPVVVDMEDYDILSHSYRIMLQKLFATVPNIVPERSAWGGFSNGAHALGVLLARRDQFVLNHFHSFFLVEGGFGSLAASMTIPDIAPALKSSRMLLLYGDHPQPGDDPTYSEMLAFLGQACVLSAHRNRFDLSLVCMRGFGHELPPKYDQLLGVWVRGEPLPETEVIRLPRLLSK